MNLVLLLTLTLAAAADDGPGFAGAWKTNLGAARITKTGDDFAVRFSLPQMAEIRGTIRSGALELKSADGKPRGEARITLAEDGLGFAGWHQSAGDRRQPWFGWRPDPDAPRDKTGSFAGRWLTTFGLMELEQTGVKLTGRYAVRGVSTIEGTVTGRRLDLHYQGFRGGSGWLDLSPDGKLLAGAAAGEGLPYWYAWKGRSAPEFKPHAPLEAGKIVDGSTAGLLTYSVRAPESYRSGDAKRWPTVVILHGSNMNGKAYVSTIAATWPEIARRNIILGINGETASILGEDPRFNYSYVNYTGKSTYQGFPGTDRESPALVAEALVELRQVYPVARYYVGGHSQGGWLTYSLLMNFPELLAGAFPVSCGLLMQCEPAVFEDQALREAERKVALAIVHARNDPVQSFRLGQAAARSFGEANWPAYRFFTHEQAAHMFARLPVDQAIEWLETVSTEDPAVLVDFAERSLAGGRARDAILALARLEALRPQPALARRAEKMNAAIAATVKEQVARLFPLLRANADAGWIDAFLSFRDEYEFAPAARMIMQAFDALRKQDEPLARQTFTQARIAFNVGDSRKGYDLYDEIVKKHHVSSLYRLVKAELEERK